MLEEQLIPAVFRRGEVVGRGDDADEVSGKPLALHAGGHHRHGADREQLGWREADATSLEEDVPCEEREERDERGDGEVSVIGTGGVDDQARVGRPEVGPGR